MEKVEANGEQSTLAEQGSVISLLRGVWWR
jgi:hypothetical protein